jgi:hypothetical protein
VPVLHAPVSHAVHHVSRHFVRRAVRTGAVPAKPSAASVACAKAPGVLPAGPGGFAGLAPVAAKTAAVAATGAAVVAGAAMFRADTDGVRLSDGNGGSSGAAAMTSGGQGASFNGYAPGVAIPQQTHSREAAPSFAAPSFGTPTSFHRVFQAPQMPAASVAGPVTHADVPQTVTPNSDTPMVLVPSDVPASAGDTAVDLPEPSSAIIFAFAALAAMLMHRFGRIA